MSNEANGAILFFLPYNSIAHVIGRTHMRRSVYVFEVGDSWTEEAQRLDKNIKNIRKNQ